MFDSRIIMGDSRQMLEVEDDSVQLVVTSPPYPMISMWDETFAKVSATSFDSMHEYLRAVWIEVERVLIPGGIACVNIGDATRTVDGIFRLYPNHSRVIEVFERLGMVTLPYILWKKPTTKPHYKGKGAFLGSGFLPPNAYVTVDMEYILIFRKGPLRSFEPKDPARYESRYTKRQRDEWFSQVWTIAGTRQKVEGVNRRVAAFPEEIPSRLIRMFSVAGDTVVDPFLGTGTTAKTALIHGRRFIGYEMVGELESIIKAKLGTWAGSVAWRRRALVDPTTVG